MRRRVGLVIALAPAAVGVALACGRSRLPLPAYGDQPPGFPESRCVPWPPPPAKPELTGEPPSERAVWVDGEWIWNGRGTGPRSYAGEWDWRPGGWVEPPFGATYARARLERMPSGALAWYPGHWHVPEHYTRDAALADGVVLDAAAPISSANVPLECPPPPTTPAVAIMDAEPDGDALDAPDAPDAPVDAREGPAVVYPPDAYPTPEPKVVPDAEIPGDAKKQPVLIQPPDE